MFPETHKLSPSTLYQCISATFCVLIVISNLISAKMVEMPFIEGFSIPAGLMFYPFTFLLSDVVTEIFGSKKAKLMVYLALTMNLLSLGIIQFVLFLPSLHREEQIAFQHVLGLSGLRIFSSLTAYLISQIIDIQLYAYIKKRTGEKFLWLRNNASTCISQLIDTILIDIIYLYYGLGMQLRIVWFIIAISFAYKAIFSIVSTPLFYLIIHFVKSKWNTNSCVL